MQRWGVFRFRCFVAMRSNRQGRLLHKTTSFRLGISVWLCGSGWSELASFANEGLWPCTKNYDEHLVDLCWNSLVTLWGLCFHLFPPQEDVCGFSPGPSGGDFRTLTTESWEKIHQRFEWRVTVKWPVHMCLWRLNNKNEGEKRTR